ncbi:MAG: hypothetical protein ACKOSR_00660, partial [Flavobacteriales bacterium]
VMAEVEESLWRAFIRRADENFPAPGVFLQFWRMEETPREEHYTHTEREKKVFELLSSGRSFSVSQLSRASQMHPAEMSQLLAKFMRWELIHFEFDNGIARYCVR